MLQNKQTSPIPALPNLALFTVFSYLTGADLLHKIALLNLVTRSRLPNAGLLTQIRILKLQQYDKIISDLQIIPSFLYALTIVDGLEVNLGLDILINTQTKQLLKLLRNQLNQV